MTPEQLLARIHRFMRRTKMKPTQFGKRALHDPMFVFELERRSREPRRATVAKVQQFMAQHDRHESAP